MKNTKPAFSVSLKTKLFQAPFHLAKTPLLGEYCISGKDIWEEKSFYKIPLKIQFLTIQLLEFCGSFPYEDTEVGMDGRGRAEPQTGSAEYSLYYNIYNYRAPVPPYCGAAISLSS